MSVIVKGMKMPMCCGRCDFNVSSLYCNRTGSEIDRDYEYRERLSDCPISKLPDKHGRLVDADSFKEHLIACAENGRPLHRMYTELGELIEAVDNIPNIVEAEDSE